jgi:predicted nucleic acid-binding protein
MPGGDDAPTVVLDASVAVRWYVPETGHAAALALLDESLRWIAPRLLLTEVGAALRRKIAAGEMPAPDASDALASLARYARAGTIRMASDEELAVPALRLALLLEHKVPDCVYLALAEAEGAGLATADAKLARLAASRGTPVRLLPSDA